MKITIKNFGPIAEAKDVDLRPLTVFVGPSNTGKSYLAVLIYALFKSSQLRDPSHGLGRIHNLITTPLFDYEEEISEELTLLAKKEIEIRNFLDLPEKLRELVKEKMEQGLARAFHEELPRCMGTSTKDNQLITDKFFLHFEDSKKSLRLSSFNNADLEIKNFSFEKDYFHRFIALREDTSRETRSQIFFSRVLSELIDYSNYLSYKAESFYLPAARTGIMQSHQAIVGALIKRAPFVGFETVSVPTLSGIVSDFLQEIISMDTGQKEENHISKIADDMEEKILKGSIKTKPFEAVQYPQFLYKQNGLEVPLLCSSSMVSELAPVVLFIRHRVGKGDLLIIEEPEAHLHPEAQRAISRVVVHLVRAGVRVMITTHSDYFLDQLANHVRLSKLTESERNQLTDRQDAFLNEDEIGAYAFNRQEGGTIVEKLHFDTENGLSPEDHDKVSSDLYNETVEILEQFDQQNNEE